MSSVTVTKYFKLYFSDNILNTSIFISFGIIEPILVSLKFEYRLSGTVGVERGGGGAEGRGVCSLANYMLHMKTLNETKSPIFVLLHVLCFQRQPFEFLFVKLSNVIVAEEEKR